MILSIFFYSIFNSGMFLKFCLLCKSVYVKFNCLLFLIISQCSYWKIILSSLPQGSVLGPLLFLMYIKNLADGLNSICKIFADDMSIFSEVFNKYKTQRDLNNELSIIVNGYSSGKCISI